MRLSPGLEQRFPHRRWFSTSLVVAILVGATLAFYHGLWQPGLVLIKRDAFRFHPPLKQYLAERLSAGELPQWFPYEGLGRPFIGVTVTGVFHPFSALYALMPVPDAYRLSTLLSCLLAALGAFVLGRMLALSRTGALLAGVTFALSGYVVSLTDNIVFLYSTCLLPLFCAALEKALRSRPVWTVVPSVLWASVFLIGDAQTGYYYGFIALLWTAARMPESYRQTVLRLAITGGLTILLAGVQLGPTWAVFANSNRAQPERFHEQALYWSTHPFRLVTTLASPVGQHADPVDVGQFFFGNRPIEGKGGQWSESLYLGIPAMGLALLGAWHRRDLRVLALLGGLALLLSVGRYGGLYEIFYRIMPFWSAFRYPEKLMGVVSFATAMLAGAGLDTLRNGKGHLTPWLTAAFLCAGVGFLLHSETVNAWTAAIFRAPLALTTEMTNSGARAFLYSAVAALGVWLIILGDQRGRFREGFLPVVLVALVILDLSRANWGAYYTGPVETATFIPPLAQAIMAREGTPGPGQFRLMLLSEETLAMPETLSRQLGHHGAGSVARRQALDLEYNAQFHIESANFNLPGHSTALTHVLGQRPDEVAAAARYNVTYYIGRRSRLNESRLAQGLVAGLRSYDLALFKNPISAKPRAYLSRQPEHTALPVDPAALIARSDFLNGEVDVIETSDAHLPGPAHEGTATIERYEPEEVRVRVETAQPAVLILLDAFDKGWTATLENGTTIPILRANALVRAVVVPAGTHVVTFSYQTPLLMAGALASLAGVLLSIGLLTHARWRMRSASVDT
jgi:hypothetical protein